VEIIMLASLDLNESVASEEIRKNDGGYGDYVH